MSETKAWWASKTIWVNLLALVGSLAVAWGLDADRWAEISTVGLAVANLALRLATSAPVGLSGGSDTSPSSVDKLSGR